MLQNHSLRTTVNQGLLSSLAVAHLEHKQPHDFTCMVSHPPHFESGMKSNKDFINAPHFLQDPMCVLKRACAGSAVKCMCQSQNVECGICICLICNWSVVWDVACCMSLLVSS